MLALLKRAAAIAVLCLFPIMAEASPQGASMYLDHEQSPAVSHFLSGVGSGVVAEAERWRGRGNITGTVGPWCADFVSFVLRRSGKPPLASRMASAGLSYGPHVSDPKPGDLVVMRGHVGFVVADHGAGVEIISGNWGHRVAKAVISRRAVVAFVRT